MSPSIEFGSREAANRTRDRPAVRDHLAAGDDRRSTTVRLAPSTPRRVIDRLESQAFETQREDRGSAGMAELSEGELQSLKRQHPTFNWQKHGFSAMRTKAALQRAGVTEWMDHYNPGEGAEGALQELRRSKKMSARTGAPASVESRRTDEEEMAGGGRRRRQAERVSSQQLDSAKDAALIEADAGAMDFLEEERGFGDVFDISFGRTDRWGRPDPTGRDMARLEEFHESRSPQSQRQDERLQAPVTRDPLEWRREPGKTDFPGVDTLDPGVVHGSRSERAQSVDERRTAPITESVDVWADAPDEFDLAGVDTPGDGFADAERDVMDGFEAAESDVLQPGDVEDRERELLGRFNEL